MKKIIAIVTAFVISLTLCACEKPEPEKTPKEIVMSACESDIALSGYLNNKIKSANASVATVNEGSNNKYTCKGKIQVTDNYGDTYTYKFTAVYSYDEETKTATQEDLDIDD